MSSKNSSVLSIAIIGTGPSGIYTLQALSRAQQSLQITLYEDGKIAGTGLPYSPLNNSVEMLSNICSLEIPPLGITFAAWLNAQTPQTLQSLGVNGPISDRAYYPRIAIGAYYKERFEDIILRMREVGHDVLVRIETRVDDIRRGIGKIEIVSKNTSVGVATTTFDCVVVATGHEERTNEVPGIVPNTKLLKVISDLNCTEVGIIGTSLSALDAMVAIASRFGSFSDSKDGQLLFELDPDKSSFHVTLMSRRGILPDADFYYPLPLIPPVYFNDLSVDALIAQGPNGLLEKVFDLFLWELQNSDPAYFACLPKSLNVDNFAQAYFQPRANSDPIAWARHNLLEAAENHQKHKVVGWRHTILRSHEVFSRAVAHLNSIDLQRFNMGIKNVFVDNYSAVPLLSIERLLALQSAGLLSVLRLGEDYCELCNR